MAFVSVFTPLLHLGAARPALTASRRAHPAVRRAASPAPAHQPLGMCTQQSPQSPQSPQSTALPEDADPSVREVVLDENIIGFCAIDPRTGKRNTLSVREKESLFLDAVQAYFRGSSVLSNDEFDALKEELTWEGSDVVTLSRDEFRFLDAVKAYEQGSPSMSDEEFDGLKKKLFEQGSVVTIQRGPRCSVQRRITFSDVVSDKRRTFVLYVPAGIICALLWLSFAFEFTPLHQIDPVVTLILGSPIIFLAARLATGLVVPNPEIMVGDCPSCGRRTHVLFGNVLTLQGFESEAELKCDKCRAQLKVERETSRMILMKEGT